MSDEIKAKACNAYVDNLYGYLNGTHVYAIVIIQILRLDSSLIAWNFVPRYNVNEQFVESGD